MPYSCDVCIDTADRLCLVRVTGEVHGSDLVAVTEQLHAHPDWHEQCDVIWDYRGITMLVVDPGDIPRIFEERMRDSVGRDFMLVGRDLEYMIARLYAYRAREAGKDVRLFWRLEDVLDALGLQQLPLLLQACVERWAAA